MIKYILIYICSFSFLFSSIMEIDSTAIKNSAKSFRWSLIPIVSQGQAHNQKYLKSILATKKVNFVCNDLISQKFPDFSFDRLIADSYIFIT